MHTHDRTLLASLGFNDFDKKNPKHTLACQYLGLNHVQRKIVEIIAEERNCNYNNIGKIFIEFEKPLSKGDGKYKTTIGFIDLFSCCNMENNAIELFVEVKINKISVLDLIRQIKLYREYVNESLYFNPFWVAATYYEMSEIDIQTLKNENIYYIHLGENFCNWMTEKDQNSS